MSKWLRMLTDNEEDYEDYVDYLYELEERAAIIRYDGQESEYERRAVVSFIKDNEECFRKYISIINGEHYLRLNDYP